jgi:hypothetical protein
MKKRTTPGPADPAMKGLLKGQRLRKNRAAVLARRRQQERRERLRAARVAATGGMPEPAAPLQDPIWGDQATVPAPQAPREPAHAPDPQPEPEEAPKPKPEPRYVRHAARMPKASSVPQGPQRGGESGASWGQGRRSTDVPVDWDRDPWEN